MTDFARQIDAMSRAAHARMPVEDLYSAERPGIVEDVPCSVCNAGLNRHCTSYGMDLPLHHRRRVVAAREHAGIRHTTTPDEET
jgi:hypothetical protein